MILTSKCYSLVLIQILKNVPHDERVDVWSIGIVTFVLLVGYPPFMDDNQSALFRKIRNGEWEFIENDWRFVSKEVKDFIRGCLTIDPRERWSMEDCLRSAWIRQDPNQLSTVSLSDSLKILKQKKNRLRTVAKAITWLVGKESRPTEDIATLAQDFFCGDTSPNPTKEIVTGEAPAVSEPSNEIV